MEIISQVKIKGAKKIKSLSDITDTSRLFYELGHYKVLRRYKDKHGNMCEDKKWIGEGIFKEIDNVKDFLKYDARMLDKEYIKHHNFVVVG